MTNQILKMLNTMKNESEQVAREIYYAMTYLPQDSPARANLTVALRILGANKPKDVGLSDSVLTRKNYFE